MLFRSNAALSLVRFDDLWSPGGIAKAHQRQGSITAHHGRGVIQHFQERSVESGAGSVVAGGVLAHDPGIGVADFLNRVRGQADDVWIPTRDTGVVTRYSLADLHQGMLDVTRFSIVLQVLDQLFVGKLPAEPGIPPEQKRHQDDQPGGKKEQEAVTRGHAGLGG